jgi:hypothetical protein
MSSHSLDARKVPKEVTPALPFAERWGIGDDFEREDAISHATVEEQEQLAHCLEQIDDSVLSGWLNGPEAQIKPPSEEYLAITNLTMAVHSAKAKLRKRQRK